MELDRKARCEKEVGILKHRGINLPTHKRTFVYINTNRRYFNRTEKKICMDVYKLADSS